MSIQPRRGVSAWALMLGSTTKTTRTRKRAVGTVKKSMETRSRT